MVIFHSYVKLPEGIAFDHLQEENHHSRWNLNRIVSTWLTWGTPNLDAKHHGKHHRIPSFLVVIFMEFTLFYIRHSMTSQQQAMFRMIDYTNHLVFRSLT